MCSDEQPKSERNINNFPLPLPARSLASQLVQHAHTEQHDEQANGNNDEQGEAKPAEDHGGGADAALDAAVAEVLGDDGRGHRRRVLPQHRHQHEHGRDEDQRQRHLAHRPARERLHVHVRPRQLVALLVPARERRQQDERQEREDDGHDAAAS